MQNKDSYREKSLKKVGKYKNVFLQGSKTHTEKLLELIC